MTALKWPSDEEGLSCQSRLSLYIPPSLPQSLAAADSIQSKSLLEPNEIEIWPTTVSNS